MPIPCAVALNPNGFRSDTIGVEPNLRRRNSLHPVTAAQVDVGYLAEQGHHR